MALEPSKSGGSKPLSGTVRPPSQGGAKADEPQPFPVPIDRSGRIRISKTGVCTDTEFHSSGGMSLSRILDRCIKSVEKKSEGREIAATYYYVTVENVIDGDGGPGRPMQPPVDGAAAGVVFAGMPARSAAA